jgi:hypothetical protein
VETNPGPECGAGTPDLTTVSYNIRGLNDGKKIRHLINQVYQFDHGKNTDLFFCMQETYLAVAGPIPFLWRGNHFLTPGGGHS